MCYLQQQFRRHSRNDGAGRQAAAWRRLCNLRWDPSLLHAPQAFPPPEQDAFGHRGNSGCTQTSIAQVSFVEHNDVVEQVPSAVADLLAKTCVMMDRKQEALQLLEEGYAHRESHVPFCLTHADLLTLKDEPRYKALVKKINFPGPTDGLPGTSTATEKSPLRASN
jgi:hypothetical protein